MGRADLLVLDAAMTLRVELIQMNLAAATTGGRVRFDRYTNEAELDETFPTRTGRHL